MRQSIKNYLLFFIILWLHITVLDLFYVTPHEIKFLWKESFEPLTIAVHLFVAMVATLSLLMISQFRLFKAKKRISLGNKFWAACSLLLVAFMGYSLL